MIQRIQTLYLTVIVVLSGITFFSPMAELYNKSEGIEYLINYKGVFLIQQAVFVFQQNVWALTLLAALIPLVSLITIFLYKKRILQIRLTIFNLVLMLGYYVMMFYTLKQASINFNAECVLSFVNAFHVINIVLNLLIIRSIAKDEALIKSLNRLR